MENKNTEISKVISVGDIVAIAIILIGLIIAIFLEEIAFRMIGVSVSILGAVALFMSISQKLQTAVPVSKFGTQKPEQEFKVTVKKESNATRKTVEDFSDSFGNDDGIVKPKFENELDNTEDSGFKVVKKIKSAELKEKAPENKTESIKPVATKVENDILNEEFSDESSSVRIVKTFKPEAKKPEAEVVEQKTNIKAENPIDEKQVKEEIEVEKITEFVEEIKVAVQPEVIKPIETESIIEEIKPVQAEIKPIVNVPEVKVEIPKAEANKPLAKKYQGKKIDIPIHTIVEIDPLLGDEPRKEFEYFLSRVLTIIRSITNTRTASFMLIDGTQTELILESYVTNIPEAVAQKSRYPLGKDIISQIFINGKPEILTEINPSAELDLLPYYKHRTGTVSFIGVPVFFNDAPIGILCADSDVEDAYDSLTVAFLGHFTKLIAALVQSYTRKYDLLQSAKTLESISMFYSIASKSKNGKENLAQVVIDSLKTIFDFKLAGVVGYNASKNFWEIKAVSPENDRLTGTKIDLDNSIIGTTIIQVCSQLANASQVRDVTRVYKDEPNLSGDSFVCVPIKSTTTVYGAIYLETNYANNFTDFDISILEIIGEQAGNAIERLQIIELFNSSVMEDINTGLLNKKAFYNRVSEEFQRWNDFGNNISIVLISLDKYQSLDKEIYPDRYELAYHSMLNKIKNYLRNYDIIGHYYDDIIGIVFIGKDANNSRMYLEQFRNEIANSVIKYDGLQISITVSIGISNPTKGEKVDSFIENARLALKKSTIKNNAITIFS